MMIAISASSVLAGAGLGATQAKIEGLRDQILLIAPAVAVILLIALAVSYAAGIIRKEDLGRFAFAIIIAGSSVTIVTYLFA